MLTVFLVLDSAAINAANVVMPALSEHLHGGASGYTVLLAANAVGGVVIVTVANRLAASPRVTAVIGLSLLLECVPLWVCYFAGSVPVGSALQVLSGAGMVIVDVLAFTSLQRDLPREVLGRVLGTVDGLLLAGSIAATFVASAILSSGRARLVPRLRRARLPRAGPARAARAAPTRRGERRAGVAAAQPHRGAATP